MSSLTIQELEYLREHLRVTTQRGGNSIISIPVHDLIQLDSCREYLTHLTTLFDSPSLMVTASQLSKRYTFLAVLPALYAMSVYNKGLDLTVKNCFIESCFRNENWLPQLCLSNWQVSEPGVDRHSWREQVVHTIFAENIAKAWRTLSKCTGISPAILWENTAVYVYWLYETKLANIEGPLRKQVEDDFRYLIQGAPASFFGETFQPLARFYTNKRRTSFSEEPLRMRKTCCLYYQLNAEGECCTGCPKKLLRENSSVFVVHYKKRLDRNISEN